MTVEEYLIELGASITIGISPECYWSIHDDGEDWVAIMMDANTGDIVTADIIRSYDLGDVLDKIRQLRYNNR